MRLRDNLGASGLDVRTRILSCEIVAADAALAGALANLPGAPVWRVETLNDAAGEPLSLGRHFLSAERFPDLDTVLERVGGSFTGAFRHFGIADYERRSTRIAARLASLAEAERLAIATGAAILVTSALDASADGTPLQEVETLFRADRIEMLVEAE